MSFYNKSLNGSSGNVNNMVQDMQSVDSLQVRICPQQWREFEAASVSFCTHLRLKIE